MVAPVYHLGWVSWPWPKKRKPRQSRMDPLSWRNGRKSPGRTRRLKFVDYEERTWEKALETCRGPHLALAGKGTTSSWGKNSLKESEGTIPVFTHDQEWNSWGCHLSHFTSEKETTMCEMKKTPHGNNDKANTTAGFPGDTVKNPSASAGEAGAVCSIPGSGRSPGGGNGNPLPILAWAVQWTEEPGGLQSMGLQRIGHEWATEHTHRYHRRKELESTAIERNQNETSREKRFFCLFV